MSAQRLKSSRQAFSALALINLCVIGMFGVMLFPPPSFQKNEVVAKAVPRPLLGPSTNIKLGIPNRIVVASIGLDLPVRTGTFDVSSQSWTLDTHSAFYADESVPANDNNGSTVIYGHAQQGLFAEIPHVTSNATAKVYTDSGSVFSYVFSSSQQVTPDDVSIFNTTGAPSLLLLTCSGPFDAYRTLVSFSLTGVSSL